MFVNAVKSTIDYCLFTLGFVLAVQLPEFIQQYKQFLAGKLSESQWHLSSYQNIADQQFGGSLNGLIEAYQQSNQAAVQQTGEHVSSMFSRHQALEQQLSSFNSDSYLEQLITLFTKIDVTDAQTVISYYQLAIPLTLQAITTGVILAFVLVWLRMLDRKSVV